MYTRIHNVAVERVVFEVRVNYVKGSTKLIATYTLRSSMPAYNSIEDSLLSLIYNIVTKVKFLNLI